jgi:hypothetical protein
MRFRGVVSRINAGLRTFEKLGVPHLCGSERGQPHKHGTPNLCVVKYC